jgi:carbon starvation protein
MGRLGKCRDMDKRIIQGCAWSLVALVGAGAVAGLALQRGESINSLWLIVAAVCI